MTNTIHNFSHSTFGNINNQHFLALIQSFFVTFGKLCSTMNLVLVIPLPSFAYHCDEEEQPVSFCIETLIAKIQKKITMDRQILAKLAFWGADGKNKSFFSLLRNDALGLTANSTNKFCIPSRNGWMAIQFLHCNFQGKNTYFFAVYHRKLAKSAYHHRPPKCQFLAVTSEKL